MLSFVTIYVAIQVLVPLRHFLQRGGIEWTYTEHRFSWQMMLRIDAMASYFYVTDPNTDRTSQLRPKDYLDPQQIRRMGWRPDMVLPICAVPCRNRAAFRPKATPGERAYVRFHQRPKAAALSRSHCRSCRRAANFTAAARWLLEIHEPLPPIEQRFH